MGGSGGSRQRAEGLSESIGIGVAAGVSAAAGVLFARKAAAAVKLGKGHPLKHRLLDLAANTM